MCSPVLKPASCVTRAHLHAIDFTHCHAMRGRWRRWQGHLKNTSEKFGASAACTSCDLNTYFYLNPWASQWPNCAWEITLKHGCYCREQVSLSKIEQKKAYYFCWGGEKTIRSKNSSQSQKYENLSVESGTKSYERLNMMIRDLTNIWQVTETGWALIQTQISRHARHSALWSFSSALPPGGTSIPLTAPPQSMVLGEVWLVRSI